MFAIRRLVAMILQETRTLEQLMKVGILGSGEVAKVLAAGFVENGHDVMLGTRTTAQLAEWAGNNSSVRIGSFADAADFGEMIALAVKGSAAQAALRASGAVNLAGKTVIDATNPIA